MGSVLAALYILSVLLIFFGLGLFLKRHVLNKRPLPTAAQQAGLAAMELFQTPNQRQAVEELEYTKKDWSDEAAAGEDIETHLAKHRGSD
ncbi:MAG: hypothetical protein B7Z68_01055 [Acidobacteria bacterium 21-70-11]|nr:MAG: hypothetical protein B7Z68_01055 [Acidobacteria bacterium 21-70-11]